MKITKRELLLIILILLLITPLRAIVILITPMICLILYQICKYKVSMISIIFVFLFFISSVIGLLLGFTTISSILLSWYIIIPILIIFFAEPIPSSDGSLLLKLFIKYTTRILYIVDILGFFAYIVIGKMADEDAFGFAYGDHFNRVHGLAIINAILSFYYLSKILAKDNSKKDIFNFLFFFTSFVFCFYGLGLICIIITFAIYVLTQFNLKQFIIATSILIGVFFIINKTNSGNINYIEYNVTSFASDDIENAPRKLLLFYQYYNFITESPSIAIVGTGPGGYNGRIAFLLNNDSDNIFTKIFGHKMPFYHQNGAYMLWNEDTVSLENYTDGTRNKPFSSMISIFAENGIIFGIIFTIFFIGQILKTVNKKDSIYIFLLLSYSYMFLLLILDMWIESSEFLYFALLHFFVLNTLRNRVQIN